MNSTDEHELNHFFHNAPSTDSEKQHLRTLLEKIFSMLNQGKVRAAEKHEDTWQSNVAVKQAILLYFRSHDAQIFEDFRSSPYWDKIPLKTKNWTVADFKQAGFRCVPGSIMRHGSYIAPQCVLMPSFVNVGAYIDSGTMIDTWATVGSCAQIGRNVHISGGAGIGGVLEPLQSTPVVIEDDCFIGARSEVAEGVIVGKGSVLSMGVYISGSTKIVNRATQEINRGFIPPYSVVVPGTLPSTHPDQPSLYCAVIVKQVDQQTREKTSINELLRL